MNKATMGLLGICVVAGLTGCARSPEPIYAEPVFDKYGAPSCRPPNMAVGGIYTSDLPLCAALSGTSSVSATEDGDSGDGTSIAPVTPPDGDVLPDDDTPPFGNQGTGGQFGQGGSGGQQGNMGN